MGGGIGAIFHALPVFVPGGAGHPFKNIRFELPTSSTTDIRCRALQRQNKCETKRVIGEQLPKSSFARACVNDI
jgi:hypothetical protein